MAALDDKLDLLAQAPEEFISSLKRVDQQMALEIIKIYTTFVVGKDLLLDAEALAQLDDAIIAAIAKTDYRLAVNAFIPKFEEVAALNTTIHKLENKIDVRDVIKESNKINNHRAVVEAQLRGTPSVMIAVTDVIDGKSVTKKLPIRNASLDELIKPIGDMIREDVILGVSFDTATQKMLDAINDGNLGLQQWAGQIGRDALSQADGIQQQEIKEEFGLTMSRYVGTISANTRPLCYHLLTKKSDPVYTDEELGKILAEYAPGGTPSSTRISYAPLGKSRSAAKGAGMIPGTDVQSFHRLRGGYNCHHSYLPISEK